MIWEEIIQKVHYLTVLELVLPLFQHLINFSTFDISSQPFEVFR